VHGEIASLGDTIETEGPLVVKFSAGKDNLHKLTSHVGRAKVAPQDGTASNRIEKDFFEKSKGWKRTRCESMATEALAATAALSWATVDDGASASVSGAPHSWRTWMLAVFGIV